MQNISAFSYRGTPNLRFDVTDVNNQVVFSTQIFQNIAAESTVRIIVGQSAYVVGTKVWTIRGAVRFSDGSIVKAGTVKVLDVTQGSELALGSVSLDSAGTYTVSFPESAFSSNGVAHTEPNVLVRYYDEGGDLNAQSVRQDHLESGTHQIDLKVNVRSGEFRVYGTVRNPIGLPVAGVDLEVYHLAWTTAGFDEVAVVNGVSNGVGKYDFFYERPLVPTPASPCGTPAGQMNLVVYAKRTVDNETEILAKSDVIFDAAKEQQVDLTVNLPASTTSSEYKILENALLPCLKGANADQWKALNQLDSNPEYVTFVAKSTGIGEEKTRAYVRAWEIAAVINTKMTTSTGQITLPSGKKLEAEVVYGLLRMGLGSSVKELLDLRPESFFTAIVESIHRGIISAAIEGSLTAPENQTLLDDWRAILVKYLSTSDSTTAIPQWQTKLLELLFPGAGDENKLKRETVAREHFDFQGTFADFCAYLSEVADRYGNKIFAAGESERIKFAFELYDACDGYLGIVEEVLNDLTDRKWTTIKDLASVTLEDQIVSTKRLRGWVSYAQQAFDHADNTSKPFPANIPGSRKADASGVVEAVRIYAQQLLKKFAGVSTEDFFKTGLAGDSTPRNVAVAAFVKNNPTFSLETGNIVKYLDENPTVVVSNELREQIKQLQRVFRLTSDFATAQALIASGLDSAVTIARMNEDEFVVKYESVLGGLAKTRRIHQLASHYSSEVLFALVKFHQHLNATGGATALTSAANLATVAAAANAAAQGNGYDPNRATPAANTTSTSSNRFPNWITLFGDLNKCACKECQTVFGPGAYMVDLLEFVEQYFGTEVLARRPDLADIEITCPNTNVAVPYIDLVNEVLEGAITDVRGLGRSFPLTREGTTGQNVRDLLNAVVDGPAAAREIALSTLRTLVSELGGYLLTDQVRVLRAAGYWANHKEVWTVEDDNIRFNVERNGSAANATPVFQTSGTNDSVEVFPEHTLARVYDEVLANEAYPFNLPLALGREETAIFLDQKNVGRHEIIEAFSTASADSKRVTRESSLAFLGLTEREERVILGSDDAPYALWGFASATNNQIHRPDKPTIRLAQGNWIELLALVPVFLHRSGLSYAELVELLELPFVNVNGGLQIVSDETDPTDVIECNYNDFQIAGLTEDVLRRASLFIRLWRKLGWTMKEVDRCLNAIWANALPTDLTGIALIKRICAELVVEPLTVLAWVCPMDRLRTRHIRTSLFDAVYLRGARNQREYERLAELALGTRQSIRVPETGQGNDPYDANTPVDYPAYLRACLELDADSIAWLWSKVVVVDQPTAEEPGVHWSLTVSRLSELYRIASFCGAVGISVKQYYELQSITGSALLGPLGAAPVSVATLNAIFTAAGNIRVFQSSELSTAEGLYYLRGVVNTPSLPPSDDAFAATLARLTPLTAALHEASPAVTTPDKELLTSALAKMMPAGRIARVLELLDIANGLDFRRGTGQTNWRYLCRYLWQIAPVTDEVTGARDVGAFVDEIASLTSTESRHTRLWSELRRYQVEQYLAANVTSLVAESFSIDLGTAELLLDRLAGLGSISGDETARDDWNDAMLGGWARASSGGTESATTTLIVPRDGEYVFSFNAGSVTAGTTVEFRIGKRSYEGRILTDGTVDLALDPIKAGTPVQIAVRDLAPATPVSLYCKEGNADAVEVEANRLVPLSLDVYEKMHRVVGLMRAMAVSSQELVHLLASTQYAPGNPNLFDQLPSATWSDFTTVVNELSLNRTVSLKETTLFEFWSLSKFKTASLQTEIAAYTGWREQDIRAIEALWTSSNRPAWNTAQYWHVLTAAMDVVRRLKMPAAQVQRLLTTTAPSVQTAAALRSIYRAEFDSKTWKDVFKPLSDQLRRRKRDALVGYLTRGDIRITGAKSPFFDANDLFGYYLIDVEMEPDTLISRIRLALNVFQLYVTRVFWGLEKDNAKVSLPEVKERWEWMRNYRVWEANRKVFLYPENWIEPELRDDKTPFFKELEAELLEREASDESGKIALATYLEKLNEVSDLEIVGATRQEVNANGISYILHVIGRTRSRTRSHFYRTFQGKQFFDGTWTPWVKVDLDIKGEVVLPCVFNGRLFLAWASIKIKQASKPIENNKNNEVTGFNVAETRAEHHADIQLMWSEYAAEQKKWLKTCVSKKAIVDLDAQSPFAIEANPEQLPPECYHLRIIENSHEAFTVAVIKTNLPATAGALEPKVLGRFRIWSNGQDTVEGPPKEKLSLKSNWPTSTILKSNQAEETALTIESEQPSDSFKFKGSTVLLSRTPEHYRVFATNFDYTDGQATNPFFFITNTKCFFGLNRGAVIQGGLSKEKTLRIKLQTFNHPHTRVLQSLLQDNGPSAIMCRPTEAMPASQNYYYNYTSSHSNYYYNYYGSMLLGYYIAGDGLARWNMERKFEIEYQPTSMCFERPYPRPTIEFGYGTPFGLYNWELFFHAPILIADRLSQDMKFEEAMKWYHYVFEPKQELTTYERCHRWANALPPGCRYWNFLPFFANPDATESLLKTMGLLEPPDAVDRRELAALIDEWKRNPFNPHLIARHRIVAYQKNVVMKYLDNLIAWGDHLFRQDTFESINLATQLYVLADQLLGKRPEIVEPLVREARYTYRELKARGLDEFSNAIAEVEYLMLTNRSDLKDQSPGSTGAGGDNFRRLTLQTFFFALPPNERLERYWDTVADRLFKIRNSMNIDGQKRTLALYEPPIDPALLVRAAAAGLDISSVLAGANAPLPHYRFATWMQKAVDLCNELKGFGAAILSALEKKDAEALQRLRQGHEIRMLKLAYKVREQQIEEAKANITALEYSKKITEERHDYYRKIEQVSKKESKQQEHTKSAGNWEYRQGLMHTAASLFSSAPDGKGGLVGPFPLVGIDFKLGSSLLNGANAVAAYFGTLAGEYRTKASLVGTEASYERRWADWKLQERLALKELEQLDKQLIAAEIRLAIAEKELENQEAQIEHAEAVREFLEDKFTSTELYRWMVTELSKSFQDVYKLAYTVARRAERTLQFELGLDGETRFIEDTYLDGLKQNLLVAERFLVDLKRMDLAYLEKNKREFELQKSVSLASLNEGALQELREKGSCTFDIPELLFDLDHPGQYFRRIKAVRLTIPCVTGPHTNVSAKLFLEKSAIRKVGVANAQNYEYGGADDTRFEHPTVGMQSIATSSAQNDGGLFELNFRDERYLPFEGAGVVSRWRLELPTAVRQFDYESISDVVIHISYTARDAGGALKVAAESNLAAKLNHIRELVANTQPGLIRTISLKKEFPDVLHQVLTSPDGGRLELGPEHFPYILQSFGHSLVMRSDGTAGNLLQIILVGKPGAKVSGRLRLDPATSGTNASIAEFNRTSAFGNDLDERVLKASAGYTDTSVLRSWVLAQDGGMGLTEQNVEDLILVMNYTVAPTGGSNAGN
jgi:hypothetical protein